MMEEQHARIYEEGKFEWNATVIAPIGCRVELINHATGATLIGGNQKHAVVREDDGVVSSWLWSEIAPLIDGQNRLAGCPLEMNAIDKLVSLPSALAELFDTSTPARIAAKDAVVRATLELLAEVWPQHADLIQGQAAAAA